VKIENSDKNYNRNGNVVYSCQYHVIFCPKYRRPVLINGADERLKEIVFELQEKHNYRVLEIEVMPEHVHLLIETEPKLGVFATVCKIKGATSRMLRKEFDWLRKRLPTLWTRSCFISSVGNVSLSEIKHYIEDQKGE
jgi:putative transposase